MKKVTLFAVAAMAVLSLASCKKDHTCTCTSGSGSYAAVTTTKAKSTKKGGSAWCSAGASSTTTVNGTAVTGGTAPSCVFA